MVSNNSAENLSSQGGRDEYSKQPMTTAEAVVEVHEETTGDGGHDAELAANEQEIEAWKVKYAELE